MTHRMRKPGTMKRTVIAILLVSSALLTACSTPTAPAAKRVAADPVAAAKAKCGADKKCLIQVALKAHAKDTYRTPGVLALAVDLDVTVVLQNDQMDGPKDSQGIPTDPLIEVKSVVCKPREATFYDCMVKLSNGDSGNITYVVPKNGKTYKAYQDPDAGAE